MMPSPLGHSIHVHEHTNQKHGFHLSCFDVHPLPISCFLSKPSCDDSRPELLASFHRRDLWEGQVRGAVPITFLCTVLTRNSGSTKAPYGVSLESLCDWLLSCPAGQSKLLQMADLCRGVPVARCLGKNPGWTIFHLMAGMHSICDEKLFHNKPTGLFVMLVRTKQS